MKGTVLEKIDFIKSVSESSKPNMDRLSVLLMSDSRPRIAVFGKYNHGKSSLLNAIVGSDFFHVADKRETTEISEYEHDGVIWIDTPGLDADIVGEDDRKAKQAALRESDFIFLVHSAKVGELDSSEMKVYKELMKQCGNYKRKLLLVLTQIDQLSACELNAVGESIRRQLPDLTIINVSSFRYKKGISEEKNMLVESSNMAELFDCIGSLKKSLSDQRYQEAKDLIRKSRLDICDSIKMARGERRSLYAKNRQEISKLKDDLIVISGDMQWLADENLDVRGDVFTSILIGLNYGFSSGRKSMFKNPKVLEALIALE